MPIASYRIGPPTRPNIVHDNGFLDTGCRRDPQFTDYLRRAGWKTVLEAAESVQHLPVNFHTEIPDALAAYRHFLDGGGLQRTFSYERYVRNDSSGATTLRSAITEGKAAAELMYRIHSTSLAPLTRFQFTGSAIAASLASTRFPYPETENWQKAIGAHSIWLSGDVTTAPGPTAGTIAFAMTMTLHAEDRYNFNPTMQDMATGIPDSANGQLECAGLGVQYTNVATLVRYPRWTAVTGSLGVNRGSTALEVSAGAPDGRLRQPEDNRRLRNRI